MITKSLVSEWLEHEVTKAYFNGIKEKIKLLEVGLGEGHTVDLENPQSTALKTAHVFGHIQGLKDTLLIDMNEIIGE